MSIDKSKDFFGDDFEVIYQEDYSDLLRNPTEDDEEDDDYNDVLSTLSELDKDTEHTKRKRAGKRRKAPNLISPAARTAKTGGKVVFRLANILLRTAALILTAVIFYLLAVNFWENHSAYGDVFRAFTERNYVLAAYTAVALLLLLFEFFTFLLILTGSKKSDRNDRRLDTGRGLFSFVFIYTGAYLSYLMYTWIPASPEPLQGVQGALRVYGSLHTTLLPLCIAGIVSCLIRKFLIR